MVSDLLEALKYPTPSLDPDFIRGVVSGNHFWALEWKLDCLSDGSPKPPELVEVLGIMDAWRILKFSFEKADIGRFLFETKRTEIPVFEGFDANNEGRHLSIARFLVNELDRYPELKDAVVNSHSPLLAYYAPIVDAVISIKADLLHGTFTTDQLIAIFKRQDQ